jgi:glycosyltransferase involved in cell wall biosynthesis
LTSDDGHDASIVPRGDAAALAEKIVWIVDHPDERARLAAAARISGQRYDIGVFVRKMERLYTLLHEVSRTSRRQGVLRADLSFLTSGVSG